MKKIILPLYNFILNPRNFFRYRSYIVRKLHRKILFFLLYFKIKDRVKYNINKNVDDNDYNSLLNNGFIKLNTSKEKEFNQLIENAILEGNEFLNLYKIQGAKDIYKDYLINLTSNFKNKKPENLLKLATSNKIVNLVSKYLGMLPTITYCGYWYSTNLNKNLEGSQLIHLDHEEFKQIKMFVYCSDVEITNGPMHVINKINSTNIQKKINYKTSGEGKRLKDEDIDTNLIRDCRGQIKSIYLVDTSSCFHFGGRVSSGDRLIGIIQFLTPLNYNYLSLKKKLPVINNFSLINKNSKLFRF